MGVKGLNIYMMQACDDVCHRVKIKDMADEHRKKNINGKPIIAVDGMAIIDKLYKGHFDWVCGGQWVEYIHRLKYFVELFDIAGIELVFFFDGPVWPEKRKEWVERRKRKSEEIAKAFYIMKHTGVKPSIHVQFLSIVASRTRFALKFKCGVKVITSVKEADIEIAEYAKHNDRVFAIFAEDTDFMIFDTKPVLSFRHLKMEDLTTVLYDRQRLISQLKLSVTQMPLFSCLTGNDFVSQELLKPFHKKLCGKKNLSKDVVIPLLSKLIITKKWEGDSKNERELAQISNEVFGDDNKMDLLKSGISFYSLRSTAKKNRYANQCTVDAAAYQRHINCENPSAIYGLLYNFEYHLCEVLEDYNDPSVPSVNLTFRPIRRRAYSILFQEDNRVRVKEWCAAPRNDISEPALVSQMPIDIQGPLPSLEALWCDSSPEIQEIKMKCFLACIGGKLTFSQIEKLQNEHKILCCALHYLYNFRHNGKEVIKPFEVAAFIAQAICPKANDVAWLESVQVTEIDARAVYLASLFLRGTSCMGMVLGICGYPIPLQDSFPWKFFNGKLFHMIYLKAKRGDKPSDLCEQNVVVIEQFRTLWNVIKIGVS